MSAPDPYGVALRAQESPADRITADGDMLDAIARELTGTEASVEALLAANPHLTSLPAVLEAGHDVRRPPELAEKARGRIRLWGRT